jgi:DNA polymerase III delta subunit
MITLLHGDETIASRSEFIRLKNEAKNKEVLDGRTIDETSLTQSLESGSLFGDEKTVFIDNLFSKLGRKIKLIEKLAGIIRNSSSHVVLWEGKEVGVTVIKSLGKADIRLFKTPAIIFQFLDQPSLKLYESLMIHEAPELIHSMLARRFRQLIQLRDGVIPEGLQGWQASKLTQQAKLFTMEKLLSMYKQLLDMEFSVKNGSSPFSLKELTEQFLYDNYS